MYLQFPLFGGVAAIKLTAMRWTCTPRYFLSLQDDSSGLALASFLLCVGREGFKVARLLLL